MPEFQEKGLIVDRLSIGHDIIRLTVHSPQIAGVAHPGQFVMVRVSRQDDPLLRRPLSIHEADISGDLQLLFKVVGQGTGLLSRLRINEELDCLGPLGRGFDLTLPGRSCLVGGGMGIAPLFFLARRLLAAGQEPGDAVLGARTGGELEVFLQEFSRLGYRVHACTDDGTLGHHGVVTDHLADLLARAGRVYTCGPRPMMAGVSSLAKASGVACQVSLEAHMACGLGACLGCTVNGADGSYLHVCTRGPVFASEEVQWTK